MNQSSKRPAKKAKAPDDGLTQSERFIAAAHALETDDDPERFAERVRSLAKASPMPQKKPRKPAAP